MANTYYVFAPQFIPGQKVRSDEMNQQLSSIETAFDLMPTDNSAILRGTTYLGVDSGTANAVEITLTDPRTDYQDGDQITWKATNTNTGATTIDIDGVGAVTLVGADGTSIGAGDIATGLYYTAIFDSANNRWQMLGASAAALAAADDRVTWASEWATQPEDVPVSIAAGGDGATDFSALHWAIKSSDSAAAALLSEGNASTSETNASDSADAAAASAAGVNLPSILAGDAGKQLKVNVGETGYEHYDILTNISNSWTGEQNYTGLQYSRFDQTSNDKTHMVLGETVGTGGQIWWLMGVQGVSHDFLIKDNLSVTRFEIEQGALPLRTTTTQLLFNGIDVQRAATETTTGLVERATSAEVTAGSDDSRYVSPLGLASQITAAEGNKGIIELATQAEVDAGTDTTRAVTPATLTANVDVTARSTGRKNLISNGTFAVLFISNTTTVTDGDPLHAEQWFCHEIGTAVVSTDNIAALDADDVPFYRCTEWDVTTADTTIASTAYWTVRTPIEGHATAPLQWGTAGAKSASLSFWHKHTVSGTYCISVMNQAKTATYVAEYTQAVSDVWEKAEIVIPGPTTGGKAHWNPIAGNLGISVFLTGAVGSVFQTTPGVWGSAEMYGTSNQVNAVGNVANFMRFGNVQLEQGPVITEFETRTYDEDEQLCHRYRYEFYSGSYPVGYGYAITTTTIRILIPLTTDWRLTPVLVGTVGNMRLMGNGSILTPTAWSSSTPFQHGIWISFTVSGATTNHAYVLKVNLGDLQITNQLFF